jgi:hypothetical protein
VKSQAIDISDYDLKAYTFSKFHQVNISGKYDLSGASG